MIDWAKVSSVLIELPVVAAVLIFIVIWSDRMTKAQESRDKTRAEMDKLMREFWTAQRKDDRQILKEVSASLGKLQQLLIQHDKKTDEAVARMMERTKDE